MMADEMRRSKNKALRFGIQVKDLGIISNVPLCTFFINRCDRKKKPEMA